jgi:protein-disulfide isomerase
MSQPPNTPSKRERRDAARAERLEREQAAAAGDTRRKRLMTLGGLLAGAVVIVVVAIVISSGGSDKKSSTVASTSDLQGVAETKTLIGGIPQSGITLGKADAPVTIAEFADPQCPYCKQYTLDAMPEVVQKYVRTGKAKMQLHLLTFIGPDSVTAANTLEGAGQQNKLWQATDLFYRNQGEENSGYVTDDFLTAIVSGAGGDAAKAIAAGGSSATSAAIGEAKTAASRYGVDSTPTILVGKTGGDLKAVGTGVPTAADVGAAVDALAGT